MRDEKKFPNSLYEANINLKQKKERKDITNKTV